MKTKEILKLLTNKEVTIRYHGADFNNVLLFDEYYKKYSVGYIAFDEEDVYKIEFHTGIEKPLIIL